MWFSYLDDLCNCTFEILIAGSLIHFLHLSNSLSLKINHCHYQFLSKFFQEKNKFPPLSSEGRVVRHWAPSDPSSWCSAPSRPPPRSPRACHSTSQAFKIVFGDILEYLGRYFEIYRNILKNISVLRNTSLPPTSPDSTNPQATSEASVPAPTNILLCWLSASTHIYKQMRGTNNGYEQVFLRI